MDFKKHRLMMTVVFPKLFRLCVSVKNMSQASSYLWVSAYSGESTETRFNTSLGHHNIKV